MAGLERFARYVQAASDPEEAAAAARADLSDALTEIVTHARGQGAFRVIQSVRTAMVMEKAVRGSEPPAAVLELVALALACRDAADDVTPAPESDAEFFPPDVQVAALRALDTGAMIPLFESLASGPFGPVVFQSTEREIMLRNAVYPHMMLDTLRGLFDAEEVDSDCRAVLGFGGIEAVNILEATRSLSIDALTGRFARMEAARDATLPLIDSWSRERQRSGADNGDSTAPVADEHRAAAEELVAALEDLTTYIDQSAVIDAGAIAEAIGYPHDTVTAVLDAFTLADVTDVNEAADRFFRGDNPLRTAPIIADGAGRRMLVHDALALPAAREVIETKLKAAGRAKAYDRHRGHWVEESALDLLSKALPGAEVYRGFNYFVPDPRATAPQKEPDEFTKRVEADGLLLVDDVALIVEVKSVSLTAEARGGVARRLQGKLRDIVTSAANQADRLRERIVTDKRIRLDNNEWIDVSGVREVHTIAVGLEDLSGVTTATSMLVTAGVLKPDHIPWTVSLHDLRIICEVVDRPCELLLYLRRRTHPHATTKYLAVDELDLYLYFLNRGLYVEPDPHQVAADLPWTGEPAIAALRRYQQQARGLIESQTEPLDAWYARQLDPSEPEAEKPRLPGDRLLLELVDDIIAARQPGWLSTTTMLLEGNAKAQRTFGRHARRLARMSNEDGLHHSATHIVTDTAGNLFVLAWACSGRQQPIDSIRDDLWSYLNAKKQQVGAERAALMLFESDGPTFIELLFDNREHPPPGEGGNQTPHLLPLERTPKSLPPPTRRGKRYRPNHE